MYDFVNDVPKCRCPCYTWFVCKRFIDISEPYCSCCTKDMETCEECYRVGAVVGPTAETKEEVAKFNDFIARLEKNG